MFFEQSPKEDTQEGIISYLREGLRRTIYATGVTQTSAGLRVNCMNFYVFDDTRVRAVINNLERIAQENFSPEEYRLPLITPWGRSEFDPTAKGYAHVALHENSFGEFEEEPTIDTDDPIRLFVTRQGRFHGADLARLISRKEDDALIIKAHYFSAVYD